MSSYAAVDRHFPTSLTSRLGPVNAEAVVVAEGGDYGDVSLGRYSTIIKPVSIPTAAPISHIPLVYTVKAGDSLQSVADKFNVTVSEIRWSNTSLYSSTTISTGDLLLIPPVHGVVVTAKSSDTLSTLGTKYSV